MMAGTWNRPVRRRSGDGRMSNASSSSNLAGTPEVPRKPHPPNKKQHEADVQDIDDKISGKEKEIETINRQFATDVAAGAERRAEISSRIRTANEDLRVAGENIRLRQDEMEKKDMEINQTRSNITYKSPAQIENIIARLEKERSTNHYSLPEEQKIINEINKLNRSKKELKKFNALRDERRQMESSLSGLREIRTKANEEKQKVVAEDGLFRVQEDRHRMHLKELHDGINSLNKQRSRLIREHNQITQEWEEHQATIRRQKQLNFEQQLRTRPADLPYDSVPRDPLAGVKQIVSNLLAYCHQLAKQDEAGGTPSTTQSLDNPPTQESLSVPVARPSTPPPATAALFEETPGYFLPKKYSDSMVTQKIVGRGKKEKKKHKPIAHSATVVAQFAKLDLFPPATYSALPDTIDQLKAKKAILDQQSQATGGSNSVTPKVSPTEETAPSLSGEDVMTPGEETRVRPRTDRMPSITLSADGTEAVVLLNNFAQMTMEDAGYPITLGHLEEVNAGAGGDGGQDLLRSDETASTVSMAEPMDHVTDSESIVDDVEQRADSGIGRYPGVNPPGTDTLDGHNLFVRSSSISEEEPSEGTAENSAEECDYQPVLSHQCDKKPTDSPPISPDTARLSVPVNGRPKEIDTGGVCPETPPIDEGLTKRPIFPRNASVD